MDARPRVPLTPGVKSAAEEPFCWRRGTEPTGRDQFNVVERSVEKIEISDPIKAPCETTVHNRFDIAEEDLVDNPVQEQMCSADPIQVIQVENSDEDEGSPDRPPVSSHMRSPRGPPDKKSSSSRRRKKRSYF
ncbi:hypothetical protein U1Q18_037816 [Sarracenia purpurea var. burkii]